jgi:orotate phosphoribosyltransferase
MNRRQELLFALRTYAFERRANPMRLASGRMSRRYLDAERVLAWPTWRAQAARLIAGLLEARYPTQAVAGVPMGGYLLAVEVSAHTELPVIRARLEAKPNGYGSGPIARVDRPSGVEASAAVSVALIEDVVTTGGSAISIANLLQEARFAVPVVATLVDREEGGREALARRGIRLESIYTLAEIGGTEDEVTTADVPPPLPGPPPLASRPSARATSPSLLALQRARGESGAGAGDAGGGT